MVEAQPVAPASKVPLAEVARCFLRIGLLGFGGPAALIAFIERECVGSKRWVSPKDFEQDYVFCKMLPGPVAYQMALATGARVRGFWGAMAACFSFLLPGVVLILSLSVAYTQVRTVPLFPSLLLGLRLGSLVMIAESVWVMFRPYRSRLQSWLYLGLGALFMQAAPRWEPLIILACGLMAVYGARLLASTKLRAEPIVALLSLKLFWIHFKAGAVVFGTGLAVLPFLERELVGPGWLTPEQFLDGLAFGQVTPGPLTVCVAFFGHQIAGFPAALAALAGVYLPGMFFVLGLVPKLRSWANTRSWLADFQLGAVAAVIGCIATSSVFLANQVLVDVVPIAIFAGLLVLRLAFASWPAWFPIPTGALLVLLVERLK
jgi:chromate transporter